MADDSVLSCPYVSKAVVTQVKTTKNILTTRLSPFYPNSKNLFFLDYVYHEHQPSGSRDKSILKIRIFLDFPYSSGSYVIPLALGF